ncbi:unnamed protein product [Calypogeia fissa]
MESLTSNSLNCRNILGSNPFRNYGGCAMSGTKRPETTRVTCKMEIKHDGIMKRVMESPANKSFRRKGISYGACVVSGTKSKTQPLTVAWLNQEYELYAGSSNLN